MAPAFTLALILATQATPSPADIDDAKCVAAMSLLDDQAEEADKAGLQAVMMFYIGKIVGRSGASALAPALQIAAPQIGAAGEAAVTATAESCADGTEKATAAM